MVTFQCNRRIARQLWGHISPTAMQGLKELTSEYLLSIATGDLLLLDGRWYVTHNGLLGLARRNRCAGINVRPAPTFSDPSVQRWAFEATVYKSKTCKGFVGYGDADPSNVSSLVRGAEMRVAETRAVNSIPIWSRPMQPISAERRLCAKRHASKWKTSSSFWRTGQIKTVML